MAKLKLGAIADDRPIKLTVELPAAVHRDLIAYAEALSRETGQPTIEPTKLIAPMLARFMGLNSPRSAMVFGGLAGTVSGVSAGLAATDRRLVPYGALVATFHTGLGCLMGPSVLYLAVKALVG